MQPKLIGYYKFEKCNGQVASFQYFDFFFSIVSTQSICWQRVTNNKKNPLATKEDANLLHAMVEA